ncbi:bifunctional diaminohydroxyphosphoribosylaminopyrimidine deaminase/5-amino-6-(5-phosphoribosylamino)uracil reductase RibD [Spirosoma sp.]|uniref:bifunctional diaminohydroxyphosphoribosylaminopyrimidine deaminase/5-amino-6-(5-phosphoribosylamino)uracil reductase RibD n=1 Tax=Spirosoma sp. TaxID=1899569 RepID=UPI002639C59E|nr:bifunctional diaminohydroxyphosphoribosylaminopyrimidine deaminase/5-amino-6-(5-phosphoribosylamino)uracil reductase RibD [Spirosoma sp.]MCX6215473.1 bifunctional diaminohydroxyphosphoribosylaminopyrimidine deaminase/5-amino-6-(5-phosphoribosylamino)uracil reductase RibD [Spirosoma sp.]
MNVSDLWVDERFMRRALELATLGRGHVSPNPMVGCVITHGSGSQERIIGEGWHKRYGDWHAEVNAVNAVLPEHQQLLSEATVYVTLEPCSHWGKTPPCADLLIERRVRRVVCCNDDPNPLVSGQGFAKLRAAGIQVETGVLAEDGRLLNARFFTFFEQKRPYILLKWAETIDGFIAGAGGQPVKISGDLAHRLVHRWRGEEDAILVGANTARLDNPRLNTRLWKGKDPIRVVLDRKLTLAPNLNLFDGTQSTLVYHASQTDALPDLPNVQYVFAESLHQVMSDLYQRKLQSILVEGGAIVLNAFMEAGLWDEMRVFRSRKMLGNGVKAPTVRGIIHSREKVGDDELTSYIKP